MIHKTALVVASLAVVLGACGGETSPQTSSIPAVVTISADGEDLFSRTVLAGSGGCINCHSLAPGKVLVGPSLTDIGVTAADRIPGTSARDYLLQAVIDPDAFLVEGYEGGRMPDVWAEGLSAEEIAALIDYMLTLGTG
jgi:mono/diheme cytochrome c family protein